MRVLFATAELAPVASVGGLAHAAAGLVRELRSRGVEVEVALPDYAGEALEGERSVELAVPGWAAPARARRGSHALGGELALLSVPGIRRPHPYGDETGAAWPDNDARFLGFSAAVAALAAASRPDLVHLNDWHTAAATAFLPEGTASVLTIHNLAYQGQAGLEWLARLGPRAEAFGHGGACNPLAGGIRLADAIVVVSPTYREEVLRPETGAGLHDLLRAREPALHGIRNGIDVERWNPSTDPHLPEPFDADDLAGKERARTALLERLELPDRHLPLAVAVTRLAHQKGIDLLLPLLAELDVIGVQVAILGAGDTSLARALREAAAAAPWSLAFVEGYDEPLSHLLFGGGDLLLMPSRFEPCGLAQMQAMRYGTLPVVTSVGGLRDTVIDLDEDPERGTGWRAASADTESFADALRRALRGWRSPRIRVPAQRRGMTADWSWQEPARAYQDLYRSLTGR
ncbi:MAG: glycogen/starch synthase [Gaiellaceae bacterium]|nr:glycogen/starch synthase [Gaiellaceae bacterium]